MRGRLLASASSQGKPGLKPAIASVLFSRLKIALKFVRSEFECLFGVFYDGKHAEEFMRDAVIVLVLNVRTGLLELLGQRLAF